MNKFVNIYNDCKKYVFYELKKLGYKTTSDIINTYEKSFYIEVSDIVLQYLNEHNCFKDVELDKNDIIDLFTIKIIDEFKIEFDINNDIVNFNNDINYSNLTDFISFIQKCLLDKNENRPLIEFKYDDKIYNGIPILELTNNQFVFSIDNKMKIIDINKITPI
jgi:hypothetical protein